MVHRVPGNDAAYASTHHQHGRMSGRVARRSEQRDARRDLVAIIHEGELPGRLYGRERALTGRGVGCLLTVLPLRTRHDIARVREHRRQAACTVDRVPADVV